MPLARRGVGALGALVPGNGGAGIGHGFGLGGGLACRLAFPGRLGVLRPCPRLDLRLGVGHTPSPSSSPPSRFSPTPRCPAFPCGWPALGRSFGRRGARWSPSARRRPSARRSHSVRRARRGRNLLFEGPAGRPWNGSASRGRPPITRKLDRRTPHTESTPRRRTRRRPLPR